MKEEDDVLISRYLAGELDAKEFQDCEDRLTWDAPLREHLQARRRERTFLRTENGRAELEAKMAELAGQHFRAAGTASADEPTVPESTVKEDKPEEKPPARVRPMRRRTWWAITGVAAAIALAVMLWNPFSDLGKDPYRQFASYEPIYLTEKSSETVPGAQAAETAFNAGDYAAAYAALTDYLRERPEDNQARLARGIAALETDRTAEAIATFRELAEGGTSFKTDGQYYIALAHLKNGDPAAAKTAIQAIPLTDPDYGDRRRAILRWLDR